MDRNRQLIEMIPVVVGLKPAVDAYRVASAKKMLKGQAVDPLNEMIYMKSVEMFAEAIPGVIIQLSAILSGGHATTAALASLSISALTIGFTSATISFDADTDLISRKNIPDFYGYVPGDVRRKIGENWMNGDARMLVIFSINFFCFPKADKHNFPTMTCWHTVMFTLMMFMSAMNILVKGMSIVLIGMLGAKWAIAYVVADLVLYLSIKVLRGDFWYWVQCEGWRSAVAVGLVARIVEKVVVDFTSVGKRTFALSERTLHWEEPHFIALTRCKIQSNFAIQT